MQQSFPVSDAGIKAAFEFLETRLKASACDPSVFQRAAVILDELCANMIRHDETLSDSDCFTIDLMLEQGMTTMVVSDPGRAFDPLQHSLDKVPEIGGQGINLIRRLSKAVSYERAGDRNFVTVVLE
jgi:anti-sigma regulatory factor (Ser/Thr protein kinase)